MSEISRMVHEVNGVRSAVGWVFEMVSKALQAGPVMIILTRPTRSKEQNAKQWAMLEDIRKSIPVWHGHKMTTDDYKDLLTAAWKGQTLLPGVDQGFVALGVRTSKLNKVQFSELIELYYAFGSERGVTWSEKSLETYAEYREVQQERAA